MSASKDNTEFAGDSYYSTHYRPSGRKGPVESEGKEEPAEREEKLSPTKPPTKPQRDKFPSEKPDENRKGYYDTHYRPNGPHKYGEGGKRTTETLKKDNPTSNEPEDNRKGYYTTHYRPGGPHKYGNSEKSTTETYDHHRTPFEGVERRIGGGTSSTGATGKPEE